MRAKSKSRVAKKRTTRRKGIPKRVRNKMKEAVFNPKESDKLRIELAGRQGEQALAGVITKIENRERRKYA